MSSCSLLPWFACVCVTHFRLRLKIPTTVTLCPSIVNVLTNIQNHPCYYSTILIPYIHLLAYVLIPVICPCYHHASPPSCFPLPSIKTACTKTAQITSWHQNHNTRVGTLIVKSKAVPLQAWSGPEGSRKLRFPTAQDGGKVVSLTHRPPLPPGNTPGTHFC